MGASSERNTNAPKEMTMNTIQTLTLSLLTLGSALATQAAPAIHSFESDGNGFNTKNFFFDNGQEVVVFDTQFTPDTAKKSLEFLRTKTKSPIRYVVVTHPNPDKFNGVSVFQAEGAEVVSSEATAAAIPGVHAYKKYFFVNLAKMLTEETYPAQAKIDRTFKGRLVLTLKGGDTVELSELKGPGVSSTQTIAWIPSLKAAVVGDLVHHNAHAWLEGGIVKGKATPTIQSWIRDLEQLGRTLPADARILGGRGEEAAATIAIPQQIRYLKTAQSLVRAKVRSLGQRAASELSGPNAQTHFAALTKDFEARFPTYALSYMIQYGVYGLAQQEAAQRSSR